MYNLSGLTKKNIERVTGSNVEQLGRMSPEEERLLVENRNGGKLRYSKGFRFGMVGRGNPLLSRRKLRTKEDIEKKSRKLLGV